METIESIQNSNFLTDLQKQVEINLLTKSFTKNEWEDIYRLLFKLVGKCNSMKHYTGDAYLNSLISESEKFI